MNHRTIQQINHTLKKGTLTLLASITITAFGINFATAQSSNNDVSDISRGQYLAYASDCMACHTGNPDKPYAGGHGLESPLGTIYATNITPDKTYGIGNYTLEEFDNAVRSGNSKNLGPLYPAMPFVSYAKMSDEDIESLYQYFMTEVSPIAEPNLSTEIEWPLNMRWPLSIWNRLLADKTAFKPQPDKSDEWNQGAYLVQGAAHCGTCHTPRDITLNEQGTTEESDLFLTGAQLGGWYAPNLRHINMNDEALIMLLKEGKNQSHAFSGPMADVTSFSLRHLSDSDIKNMVTYLRDIELPITSFPKIGESFNPKSEGYILYQDFCSTCHGTNGEGVPFVAPTLRDRGNGEQGRSLNVANALLFGAQTAHREDQVAYSMPSYQEELTNTQITNIVNFIMNNKEWNNHNALITEKDVVNLKENKPIIRGWWIIAAGGFILLLLLRFIMNRRKKNA